MAYPGRPPDHRRCRSLNHQGVRCWCWSIRGAPVCQKHGGQLPVVKRAAKRRVAMREMAKHLRQHRKFEDGLIEDLEKGQ
jgi:hypothetical protein